MNIISALPPPDIVREDEPFYLDTETDGLYGQVQLIQMYQESWGEDTYQVRTHKDDMLIFEVIALTKNCHVIGHNLKYDMSCLGITYENYDDTFFAARLKFPYWASFSLDNALVEVTGSDPYLDAGLDKKEMAKSDYGGILLTKSQKIYGALDVYTLPAVYHAVKSQFTDISYTLDKHNVNYALSFEKNGFPVNREALETEYEVLLDKDRELAKLLPPGLNVNSYKQVRAALGDITESSADVLLMMSVNPYEDEEVRIRAKAIIDKRKALKTISFLNKFTGDRIYGRFSPSTRSGRYQSSHQNLQQLPRSLKHIFGFKPHEGRVLVYADFASLEIRTICAILGEPKMLEIMKEDGDLHTFTATKLFNCLAEDVDDEMRAIGKVFNFMLLYGGSVWVVQATLLKWTEKLFDETTIKGWIKSWKAVFPRIAEWQTTAMKAMNKGTPVNETPLGRKYTAERFTDYLSIQNQGYGAEIAKLAMHYMMPKLAALNEIYPNTFMVNFVHDSYTIECDDREEIYSIAAEIVAEAMFEAWTEGSKLTEYKLPMPVTCGVSYNWKDVDKKPFYTYKIDYKGNRSHGSN